MLGLNHQTSEMVLVVHHRASDGPICPFLVWGSNDMHSVCLDVLAAISLVEKRRWQRRQVEVAAEELVSLTGPSATTLGGKSVA
jgi:hypothetical protein